jgi:hypothetical protein
MTDEIEVPESEDIVAEFEDTPDGDLKQSVQEENLNNEDFDYQQGFGTSNYPEAPVKDSITKFYRDIISLMVPKKVVRVANFSFADKKNARICLNLAFYNKKEGSQMLEDWWNDRAVNLASVSMGHKGFIVTNIMTQRRIVQRQTDKANPTVKGWNKPKPQ